MSYCPLMSKNSFEQSATKETIRAGIASQMLSYAKASKKTKLWVRSLPGVAWRFEARLHALMDFAGINLSLDGFERDWSIIEAGNIFGVPANYYVELPASKGDCHTLSYFSGDFSYCDGGDSPHAVWADYCGFPIEKELNAFSEWMNNGGEIGYVTFSLSVRIPDCLPKEILQDWKREGITYAERATLIKSYIQKRTKARLIFERIYQNDGSRAIMLTVGFIKLPASLPVHKYVKPILADDFAGQGPNTTTPKASNSVTAELIAKVRELVSIGLSKEEVARAMGRTTMQVAGIKAGAKRLGL